MAAAAAGGVALVMGTGPLPAGAASPEPAEAPAVVSTAPASLDAFVRDPATKGITQQSFRSGGWGKPVALGGSWLYGPGAASDPSGKILLAAVGADHKVSVRTGTGGTWTRWSPVDGAITTTVQPAVASFGPDSFALVVRGQENHGWIRTVTAGHWTAWRPIGGTLTTAPAAAGLPDKAIGIVAGGTGGALSTTTVSSSVIGPAPRWTPIGGTTTRTPGLMVDPATGQWEIVATDSAGKLMQRQQLDATNWAWTEIGGGAESGVGITTSGKGEGDLLALGSGRALSHASLVRQYYPEATPRHQWGRLMPVVPARTGPGTTNRVSVNDSGIGGNGPTIGPAVSGDGRYVAFTSGATNMVPGDTDRGADVYVRDRMLNTVTQASIGSHGEQGNNASFEPSISGDGRYVAFVSPGDFGEHQNDTSDDIFVRDMTLHTTTRVSLTPDGKSPNGGSDAPSLSADGRYVAFVSVASNLVAGDVNGKSDVFVRNLVTGETVLASVATDGTQADAPAQSVQGAPHLSADGRYVSFVSKATTLVPGDTNGKGDVFVRDLKDNVTIRGNSGPDGVQADGESWTGWISGNGRYVAFDSDATNLAAGDTNRTRDIFVRDLVANTTRRIVRSDGTQLHSWTWQPSISDDGQTVAFTSRDDGLVPGDTNGNEDGFVQDLRTGKTTRINLANSGAQSDSQASADVAPWQPSISGNGKVAVFGCEADDLVPRDVNRVRDIFAHEL
jgi:Tol biopolymer transport system component